jgi:hypothetical protein
VAEANALLALAMGRSAEGVDHARMSLAKAAELPRRKYQAQASTTLARCLLAAGDGTAAVESAASAVTIAEDLLHPPSVWRAADVLSKARAATGDDGGAAEAASKAAEEVERFGRSLRAERASTFWGAADVAEILARDGRTAPVA